MTTEERKQSCGEGCGCEPEAEAEASESSTSASAAPAGFAVPGGFAAMLERCARMFAGTAPRAPEAAQAATGPCGKEA